MENILSRSYHILPEWIPSHCVIDANEAAIYKIANIAALQNSLLVEQTVSLVEVFHRSSEIDKAFRFKNHAEVIEKAYLGHPMLSISTK